MLWPSGNVYLSTAPSDSGLIEVFVTPVAVADVPIVREWVGETRGASFTFEYLVEAAGQIAAEAVTKLACVDKTTGRPVAIEPDVLATLETLQSN